MRRVQLGVLCLLCGRVARSPGNKSECIHSDQIKYGPPPFVAAGAQLAVIEGDPTASSGDFTIRSRCRMVTKSLRTHPKRENVTVISGNFKVGMGDKWDASNMMTFPAGSFAYLDPDMHHYVMASGEAVVQVHWMSPLQFNYMNPADDPSKK